MLEPGLSNNMYILAANPCPIGYKCPAQSEASVKCDAGTYQDLAAQWECKVCEEGKHCPTGKSDMVGVKF